MDKPLDEISRAFLDVVDKFGTLEAVASAVRSHICFRGLNRSTIHKLVRRANLGQPPNASQALIVQLLGDRKVLSSKEIQLGTRLDRAVEKLFDVETELKQIAIAIRANVPKRKKPRKLRRKRT